MDDLNPVWKPFSIKVQKLCAGDYNRTIKVDSCDCDCALHVKFLQYHLSVYINCISKIVVIVASLNIFCAHMCNCSKQTFEQKIVFSSC